jgi:hypothetical protein
MEERFTVRRLFLELFESFSPVERKGLPGTIRYLFISPGTAIHAYLRGRRRMLYPPFKYLLLIGAVVIVLSWRYHFFNNEIITGAQTERPFLSTLLVDKVQLQFVNDFFVFAEERATLLNIIAIPVFAFFSWAFLSGTRYNFAENLILNTYITSQQLFMLLATIPFLEIFPAFRQGIITCYTIIVLIYNITVYMDFFQGRRLTTFFTALVVVLISYVYQFPLNLLGYYLYRIIF